MNSKLREAGKKEEKRRLKEFVENAYRCDLRVIARKEEQKAERCVLVMLHKTHLHVRQFMQISGHRM